MILAFAFSLAATLSAGSNLTPSGPCASLPITSAAVTFFVKTNFLGLGLTPTPAPPPNPLNEVDDPTLPLKNASGPMSDFESANPPPIGAGIVKGLIPLNDPLALPLNPPPVEVLENPRNFDAEGE